MGQHAGINATRKKNSGWVNMQEWWVNINRNGGSTWTGIYKPLNKFQTLTELIEETTSNIQSLISQINFQEFVTELNKKDDDRWVLIYMILLDRKNYKEKVNHFKDSENEVDWDWFNKDEETSIAYQYFGKVFGEILFAESPKNVPAWQLAYGNKAENPLRQALHVLKLGQPPADIARQLAYLAIASPAVCAYRLLSASTASQKQFEFIAFYCAFRIADSFRKFFNWSENIAVIDKYSDSKKSYWQNLLSYSADGNFQSMLDEFATGMIDHNGLWDYSLDDKLSKLIELVSDNIGLRTVSVTGHTYESFIKESKSKHFRCHFGVALNQSLDNDKDVMRSDSVRDAFNSPFRPLFFQQHQSGKKDLTFICIVEKYFIGICQQILLTLSKEREE